LQELDLSLCSVSAKAAPQLLQLPLRQLQLLGSEQMDVQERHRETDGDDMRRLLDLPIISQQRRISIANC
jgi:hypothetical protein